MKFRYIFLLLLALLISSCSDDDDNNNTSPEEEQEELLTLPPATQTGANTFGCIVNGEVFIDQENILNIFYEPNGFFLVGAYNASGPVNQVTLNANTANLEEGVSYSLDVNGTISYYGEVLLNDNFTIVATENMGGTMTITKLDTNAKIIAGTFSFDVSTSNGMLLEIREGRFDYRYE